MKIDKVLIWTSTVLLLLIKQALTANTEYKVVTKTGNEADAGTKANVYITIYGENGRTKENQLKKGGFGRKAFKKGRTDEFNFDDKAVGDLSKITIRHDNTGKNPSWYLESVTIDVDDKSFEFLCNCWLDSSQEGISRTVYVSEPPVPEVEAKTEYKVVTKTGDEPEAGTQANVYITISGENGMTEEKQLKKGRTIFKTFKKGGTDTFKFEEKSVGDLSKITIRHDNTGENPSWYLESVTIDVDGKSFEFPCNCWLDSSQGGTSRTVNVFEQPAPQVEAKTEYKVVTKTGDEPEAGTQANVYITISGENGMTEEKQLKKGRTIFKTFKKGGTDTFKFEEKSVGDLSKITIRHDDTGENPSWYLESVKIKVDGVVCKFPCNCWLDKDRGGTTIREIYAEGYVPPTQSTFGSSTPTQSTLSTTPRTKGTSGTTLISMTPTISSTGASSSTKSTFGSSTPTQSTLSTTPRTKGTSGTTLTSMTPSISSTGTSSSTKRPSSSVSTQSTTGSTERGQLNYASAQHYWPFDVAQDHISPDVAGGKDAYLQGNAEIVPSVRRPNVVATSGDAVILGNFRGTCFSDPTPCASTGMTVMFWLELLKSAIYKDPLHDRYLVSSGAQTKEARGFFLAARPKFGVYVEVVTADLRWESLIPEDGVPEIWFNLAFSWRADKSLHIYINGKEVGKTVFAKVKAERPEDKYTVISINKPNHKNDKAYQTHFKMDDLAFFSRYLTGGEIKQILRNTRRTTEPPSSTGSTPTMTSSSQGSRTTGTTETKPTGSSSSPGTQTSGTTKTKPTGSSSSPGTQTSGTTKTKPTGSSSSPGTQTSGTTKTKPTGSSSSPGTQTSGTTKTKPTGSSSSPGTQTSGTTKTKPTGSSSSPGTQTSGTTKTKPTGSSSSPGTQTSGTTKTKPTGSSSSPGTQTSGTTKTKPTGSSSSPGTQTSGTTETKPTGSSSSPGTQTSGTTETKPTGSSSSPGTQTSGTTKTKPTGSSSSPGTQTSGTTKTKPTGSSSSPGTQTSGTTKTKPTGSSSSPGTQTSGTTKTKPTGSSSSPGTQTSGTTETKPTGSSSSPGTQTSGTTKTKPTGSSSSPGTQTSGTTETKPTGSSSSPGTQTSGTTETKPTSTSGSPFPVAAAGITNPDEFRRALAEVIGLLRRMHSSSAAILDEEMSRFAQMAAEKVGSVKRSLVNGNTQYRSNICIDDGPQADLGLNCAAKWYSSVKDYDWLAPRLTPAVEPFVHLVWRETKRIGIGVSRQPSGKYVLLVYFDIPGINDQLLSRNVIPTEDVFEPTLQSKCPENYKQVGQTCFTFHSTPKTWENAVAACAREESVLWTLQNQQEENTVKAIIAGASTDTVWLGLHDRPREGYFIAVSGRPVNYFNWSPYEPNGGTAENCVDMTTTTYSGSWADRNCNEQRPFICRKPLPGIISYRLELKIGGSPSLAQPQTYTLQIQLQNPYTGYRRDQISANIHAGVTKELERVYKDQDLIMTPHVVFLVVDPSGNSTADVILKFGPSAGGSAAQLLQDYLDKNDGKFPSLRQTVTVVSFDLIRPGTAVCTYQCLFTCNTRCQPYCCTSRSAVPVPMPLVSPLSQPRSSRVYPALFAYNRRLPASYMYRAPAAYRSFLNPYFQPQRFYSGFRSGSARNNVPAAERSHLPARHKSRPRLPSRAHNAFQLYTAERFPGIQYPDGPNGCVRECRKSRTLLSCPSYCPNHCCKD